MSASTFSGVYDAPMRHKGSQEGSVRKRGDRWYGIYYRYVPDLEGNLLYKRREVALDATNERAARKELRDNYVSKANAQTASPEGNVTLLQFVEARFRPDHMGALRKGGKTHYETQLKHILPTLGDIRLADIRPMFVQQLIVSKSKVLSAQSVRHIRNALSAIFRHARELGFIEGMLPTEATRVPSAPAAERKALSKEQVNLLMAALHPRYRPVIHFMLATGCRASEAAGLRWQDVNLSSEVVIADGEARHPHTVHFRHGWKYGEYAELKTKNARRNVPMTPALWVELQTLYERRNPDCEAVFTLSRGKDARPVDMHNLLRRVVKPIGERLGMPWLNLHCLRHTTSTWLDASGMAMGQRLLIMGHGSVRATMRYIHPDNDSQREALENATAALDRKPN